MPGGTTQSRGFRVEVRGNLVRVVVEEDANYSWEELREELRARGLGGISEELEGGVRELLEAYTRFLDAVPVEDLYDVVRPGVDGRGFNFGELVGFYSLGLPASGVRVELEVVPKVGWGAYRRMVGEALEIPVLLGSRGVLRPVLSATTYQALHSPLSYSLLLLDLTREVLSAPLPRRVEEYRVVSEGSVGRPDHHATYVLRSKGYPLGVFTRLRVGAAHAPLMLLAVFHDTIARDLEELRRAVGERYQGSQRAIEGLLRELDALVLAHRTLLWTTELREHYLAYLRLRPSTAQLVGEAYRQAGFNTLLKTAVELYVSYLGRAELRHEVAGGRLNPVASSKVYELWVLSKLLKYLRGVAGPRGLVEEEAADLYLVVRAGGVRVYYNKPLRAPITTELLSGAMARPAELRPDFVVESGGGALVLDAKYRRGIGREDIERLITYVVEFARPVGGVLYGSLLTLEYVQTRRASRDSSLGVRVEIEVNTLDPRHGEGEVLGTVGRVLGRLGTWMR